MDHHHDDFQQEPVRGLPELPPEGERILWQGSPNWWRLACEALLVRWVAGYFVLLAAWRGAGVAAERGVETGLQAVAVLLVLGLIACAILVLSAWVQAKATVYTITNRRVAMRVGAALTVTLNLPYRRIASADLAVRKDGSGTITLEMMRGTKFSYLVLWPHIRPWHFARPQPALRAIPNAAEVAALLGEAARARVTETLPGETATPIAAE